MRYDVAVIGGGLAGLATAIQLADRGKQVILFEKRQYPFHRVCGEYISMESWDFLNRLGLDLASESLPMISKLNISAPSGSMLSHDLDPGGFGISRFKLDELLASQAALKGVHMQTGRSVTEVVYHNEQWHVTSNKGTIQAKMAVGTFGKRSNLDKQFNRKHQLRSKHNRGLTNYVAVKYHVKADLPTDTIELHNFENGYCGISKVEDDRYCMCYLTTSGNLERSGHDIAQMEQEILGKNPILKSYFNTFERCYDKPLSIAQIDFSNKKVVEHDLPMIGDAAGLITPLCGNGMSMALRGSTLAVPLLDACLAGKLTNMEMQAQYKQAWRSAFRKRLIAGRLFQSLFGNRVITERVIALLKQSPRVMNRLVRLTHGEPF
jgi:flavin-dependent dehydrogenase